MGSSVGSYYVVYNMDATLKTDVIAGLPAYMPNPDKVVPHWPKDNRDRRVEETHESVDKRAEEFKNNSAYAYHPHNMNKHPQGQIVDFVIA